LSGPISLRITLRVLPAAVSFPLVVYNGDDVTLVALQ
jgi:hypothetical protein